MKSELCNRCADIYCCMFSPQVTECQDFLPMTNADRIRAMTEEELAEYLSPLGGCPPVNCGSDGCETCWLDWLKQEVERNEDETN